MAPYRPTHINKRAYPGNANVVGPTTRATVGVTTTQCCVCNCTLCGAAQLTYTLGCRFLPTAYPCCHCCCCCSCTIYDRTVPGGMWKSSEQWEAKSVRDAWGDDNCVTGPQIGFCANSGTITGCTTDCKGFLISGTNWFVAPSCTQVATNWYSRNDAVTVANSLMGSLGWFVPSMGPLQNPGYTCRIYWDSYSATSYWSSEEFDASNGCFVRFTNGVADRFSKSNTIYVRAFRNG